MMVFFLFMLRVLIGRKHTQQEEEKAGEDDREEGEVVDGAEAEKPSLDDDPFASLVKRPKPLYSDRPNDLLDTTEMMDGSERERVLAEVSGDTGRVGLGSGEGDLRLALQRRKKKRNLKLRVGYHPRLVEEK
jgi:hypothetical protein